MSFRASNTRPCGPVFPGSRSRHRRPVNAAAWCIRGNYYNDAFGQFGEALESYHRSLELDPEYAYAWFSKGVTLQNLQRFDEVRASFE
ncbi:MAG: tetratricopeptide repeat protein [Methanospirillum sp.]|nr:tetratricopeptide repeat protein [Methanospirillum sp.]